MTRTMWGLCAGLLAGCAGVGPLTPVATEPASTATPAAWHHLAPSPVPTPPAQVPMAIWWQVFDDPLMSQWVT